MDARGSSSNSHQTGLPSPLERCGRNFLHGKMKAGGSASWNQGGLPGAAAVGGFETFVVGKVPNRGVQRVGGANTAKIVQKRERNQFPVCAAIGREKNCSTTAHDPADSFGGRGAGLQVDVHSAFLARPGGSVVASEFDDAGPASPPKDGRARPRPPLP